MPRFDPEEAGEAESMGAARWLRIRRLLYGAALRLSGKTLQNLGVLKAHAWLPREQVYSGQQARLRRLLVHASSQVPYYRQVLADAGVLSGSGDVHLDRFSNIPLLDKTILHERNTDLQSLDLDRRKWYRNSSGGSTGEPARFVQDQEFADWGRAVGLLFDLWAGYSVGESKIVYWSNTRDLSASTTKLKSRVAAALRNEIWLDARRMSPEQMRSFFDLIARERPAQLLAFPENLYELARFATKEGLEPQSPRAIVTTAATLYPWMRRAIEGAFGAEVFNSYGSREVSGIAMECEAHKGLHVCLPVQHIEILRPDGSPTSPGELGEVVVTCLVNWAMPLIRYRIGDMAAWGEDQCPCGRSWPLLKEVAGRTRDLFVKKDGTRVRIWENIFHRYPWIRKFQVVQEDYEFVRALIVLDGESGSANRKYADDILQIEAAILDAMGPECKVEVVLTDRIEATASGKFRHHISRVN
ncbi:MAG: phenylacetate--CoA ligase family protein [Anaerolineales bacterium]